MNLAQERAAEFERLRKAKLNLQRSEKEDLERRRKQMAKQFFDSINDDEEYN